MQYIPANIIAIADATVPGWQESLSQAGIAVEHHSNDGNFYCSNALAAAAILASYDPIPFARKQKMAELETKYRAIQLGGHVTATVPSLSILTDEQNVQAMMLAYMLVQSDATQVYVFKDATGTWRSLSKAQTLTLLSDFAIWRKTVDQKAMAIAALIAAASTWQAVQAIDVTSNWPG